MYTRPDIQLNSIQLKTSQHNKHLKQKVNVVNVRQQAVKAYKHYNLQFQESSKGKQ